MCLDKHRVFDVSTTSTFTETFGMSMLPGGIVSFVSIWGNVTMQAVAKAVWSPVEFRDIVQINNMVSPETMSLTSPYRRNYEEYTQRLMMGDKRRGGIFYSHVACMERLQKRVDMNASWKIFHSSTDVHVATGGLMYRALAHELLTFDEVFRARESLTDYPQFSLAPGLPDQRDLRRVIGRLRIDDKEKAADIIKASYEVYTKTPFLLCNWHGIVSRDSQDNGHALFLTKHKHDRSAECEYRESGSMGSMIHSQECKTERSVLDKAFAGISMWYCIRDLPIENRGCGDVWSSFYVSFQPIEPLTQYPSWEAMCLSAGITSGMFSHSNKHANAYSIFSNNIRAEDMSLILSAFI